MDKIENTGASSTSILEDRKAETKKQPRTVLAETTGLIALSILSPVAGLAVEIAMAWRFGTSPVVDAYRVAVLLILFGQQLFVTSILPYVVVPIFAEYRNQGNEQDAWRAVDSLANLLLIMGSLIALFFFVFPTFASNLLAPGLVGEGRATAIFFIRWCGLAFIPLCWSGVACGVLYAHQIFRVAPIAQLLTNLSLVLAIVAGGAKLGAVSVALGVVVGALGSASLYAIRLMRVRRQFAPGRRARGIDLPALRKLFRLALPLLGGAIVGQTSGAVVARALSLLSAGSLAAFGYGWKLGQIVLLTPSALSTVLFPKLSATWHSSAREDFTASYVKMLRAMFFITMPLTCVVYALREPVVKLLLQRGAFSVSAGHLTATLFGLLILGAPGTALSSYLDRMFYATQETRLPVMVDISCAFLAMALVPLLASRFGAVGVAFAYMLLPWITGAVLLALFQYKHGKFPFKTMGAYALKITGIAGISAWAGATAFGLCQGFLGSGLPLLIISLGSGTVLAVGIFLTMALLLRLPEAADCLGYLRRYAGIHRHPAEVAGR